MTITQTRCIKCNGALETTYSRHLGMGPDCETNVEAAFNADVKMGYAISGDRMFDLLALFATESHIEAVRNIALMLVSVCPEKAITWDVVVACFTIARTQREHGDENGVQQLLTALGEIIPCTTAMALGEASAAEAQLDYDPETRKVGFMGTTVRKASEGFCKLASVKRHGTRAWEFDVRDAEAVFTIARLRWPLLKVTESFKTGLEICKNLPPLPPAPERFSVELALDFMTVVHERLRYGSQEDAAHNAYMRNTIGACWNGPVAKAQNKCAWLVPTDRIEEVKARLAEMFPPLSEIRNPTAGGVTRGSRRRAA